MRRGEAPGTAYHSRVPRPGRFGRLGILWSLYFVQGLPFGFQATALPVSLRSEGMSLAGVGLATAHARMEGLRRRCATQIVVLDGRELRFSTSMGVASFPHTAADPPALWAACDAALAEARRRGGNQVVLASIRFDDTR